MFREKVEGEMSDWAAAPLGVPQGFVVGPILLVVYITALPEALSSASFPFADDLKIVNGLSKAEDLTTYLQAVALRATQCDMELSWVKCKTWHFGRGQAPELAVEDELGSHVMEQVDYFKDLEMFHSRI